MADANADAEEAIANIRVVKSFTGLYAQLQQGIGASRRVFDLLDERPDLPVADPPTPLPDAGGEVRIAHVWFRYPRPSRTSGPSARTTGCCATWT